MLAIRVLTMPFAGVLIYYWLGIMNPHKITYGGPSIRWTLIFSILTLVAIIFSSKKHKLNTSLLFVLVIFFYIWTCVTTVVAVFDNAPELLMEFSKTMLAFVLTVMLATTKPRLHVLIWILVISSSVYILREGAYLALTGGRHLISGPPKSPFFGNNDLSRLFGMTFPFLLFLAFHTKKLITRWFLWIVIIFDIIALVGAQSRGALAAFIVMGAFLLLKSKRKLTMFFVISVCSSIAFFVFSDSNRNEVVNRYKTIESYEEDKSFQGRVFAWNYGYKVAVRNPLFGDGFGAFQGATMQFSGEGRALKGEKKEFIDAHSIYFEAMGEHGLVGFGLFVMFGIAGFFTALNIERVAKKYKETYWERDLAIAIQASLIFYFVGGTLISHTYLEVYYLLIASIVVLDAQLKGKYISL